MPTYIDISLAMKGLLQKLMAPKSRHGSPNFVLIFDVGILDPPTTTKNHPFFAARVKQKHILAIPKLSIKNYKPLKKTRNLKFGNSFFKQKMACLVQGGVPIASGIAQFVL